MNQNYIDAEARTVNMDKVKRSLPQEVSVTYESFDKDEGFVLVFTREIGGKFYASRRFYMWSELIMSRDADYRIECDLKNVTGKLYAVRNA